MMMYNVSIAQAVAP